MSLDQSNRFSESWQEKRWRRSLISTTGWTKDLYMVRKNCSTWSFEMWRKGLGGERSFLTPPPEVVETRGGRSERRRGVAPSPGRIPPTAWWGR